MTEENSEGPPGPLDIKPPKVAITIAASWTLIAHNRNVLKGWEYLSRHTPEDAQHCYDWLHEHAMLARPRRCYALKGRAHAGCWCYEIGSGNRVYYKPDDATKTAVIYYAGPHPNAVPVPPKSLAG